MLRRRKPVTRAFPVIAVVAIGLGAALPVAEPVSAREAGDTLRCLGEEGYQLPGTWHIEDARIAGGRTFGANGSETGPGQEGASDGESLQSDCALV